MIVLINPRATRPKNRRFPLSVMAIGAALPSDISWEIVDGNRPGCDPFQEVSALIESRSNGGDSARAIAMSVMPGPQLVNAVPLAARLKERFSTLPMIWGGYFPSLYPRPVLAAPYVDWVVRGQGERTFAELLDVLDGRRDPKTVAGLAFRDDGSIWIGGERPWQAPDDLPTPPWEKIDVSDYLRPTFLGGRSGVYQASIGCPYRCNFCGVISVFGSREKFESPARTAEQLSYLVRRHGMNGLHFYDSNFFVKEDHAVELCQRMVPLNLSWWCEARVDAMLRFSDTTWRLIRRSGLKMVFFGAESGSDHVLRKMAKHLTSAQTQEVAAKAREHGVIPEFSFVLGDPDEPERELEHTLAFIRRIKGINPKAEIVTYFYTPIPQRRGTYGNVDPLSGTPQTLEEWCLPEWVGWMTHENPQLPWLTQRLKARVEDFEVVLKSRFPSLHDTRTRRWGTMALRLLAARRWRTGYFDNPTLLRAVRRWARIRDEDGQAYGHLRPAPGIA